MRWSDGSSQSVTFSQFPVISSTQFIQIVLGRPAALGAASSSPTRRLPMKHLPRPYGPRHHHTIPKPPCLFFFTILLLTLSVTQIFPLYHYFLVWRAGSLNGTSSSTPSQRFGSVHRDKGQRVCSPLFRPV